MEKMMVLDDRTVVLPGHGPGTTDGAEAPAQPVPRRLGTVSEFRAMAASLRA